MTGHLQASLWVLLLTSATLFWVALTDFRKFKIPNGAIVTLAICYFVFAIVSGRWASVAWNVGFAALMLAGLIYIYVTEKMGGGDLKLLAVAFLWTGPWLAVRRSAADLHRHSLSGRAVRLGDGGTDPGWAEDSVGSFGGGSTYQHFRIGLHRAELRFRARSLLQKHCAGTPCGPSDGRVRKSCSRTIASCDAEPRGCSTASRPTVRRLGARAPRILASSQAQILRCCLKHMQELQGNRQHDDLQDNRKYSNRQGNNHFNG